MNKEYFEELNEIRKNLEISKADFIIVLLLALKYKKENEGHIYEELIYEIVKETLCNIDYQNKDDVIKKDKTLKEAFNRALVNLGYCKTKKNF